MIPSGPASLIPKNMKRLLIAALMLNLLAIRICSETIDEDGNYIIPAYLDKSAAYSLSFPSRLDVTSNTTSFEYRLEGDIFEDSRIVIAIDGAYVSDGSRTVELDVVQDRNVFTAIEVLQGTGGIVTISHSALKAGSWNGTLEMVITLQEG